MTMATLESAMLKFRNLMALAAAAPRKMISFTPALWNTLLALTTALMVSAVAIGQYLAGRQKGWQDLAESRAEKIDDLQRDHSEAIVKGEAERDALREQLAAAIALHARDQELQILRIEALEAQVAQVQRQNHILQVKLDDADARNAAQHHTRRPRLATDHEEIDH